MNSQKFENGSPLKSYGSSASWLHLMIIIDGNDSGMT